MSTGRGGVTVSYPKYDDGLDADGYPIDAPTRLRYVRGEEEECPAVTAATPLNEAWLSRLAFAAELSKRTESPIETMMGLALHEAFLGIDVQILPQYPFRRFRIDWAVQRGKRLAFIECDGAEFHTRPLDVARDRAKDAAAAAAGVKMFRFTGSDIYRGAEVCAWTVRDWMGA
jgi:very-short-patch-repair endonuclease